MCKYVGRWGWVMRLMGKTHFSFQPAPNEDTLQRQGYGDTKCHVARRLPYIHLMWQGFAEEWVSAVCRMWLIFSSAFPVIPRQAFISYFRFLSPKHFAQSSSFELHVSLLILRAFMNGSIPSFLLSFVSGQTGDLVPSCFYWPADIASILCC